MLPELAPYEPLPGEVEPGAKAAAVGFLAAALTTPARRPADPTAPAAPAAPADDDPADDVAAGVRDRVVAVGQPPEPADALLPLLGPGAVSTLRVGYPQSGGLAADRLSGQLMIVATQLTIAPAAPDEIVERPLTVRVPVQRAVASDPWLVTEVVLPPPADSRPTRPASAASAAVRELLATPRVVLPEAARLDLLAEESVDDRVARTLTALAERWVVDVSVFRTGHAGTVFGTDRVSNHAVGRAVDIWALDGIPIVEQDRSPWREAMVLAAEQGASEVGGPAELSPEPYFSDASHQDHIHVGFGP